MLSNSKIFEDKIEKSIRKWELQGSPLIHLQMERRSQPCVRTNAPQAELPSTLLLLRKDEV